jgi:hypothetical protein
MGRTCTSRKPASSAYSRSVLARITVPIPAEGSWPNPTGKQCSTLEAQLVADVDGEDVKHTGRRLKQSLNELVALANLTLIQNRQCPFHRFVIPPAVINRSHLHLRLEDNYIINHHICQGGIVTWRRRVSYRKVFVRLPRRTPEELRRRRPAWLVATTPPRRLQLPDAA